MKIKQLFIALGLSCILVLAACDSVLDVEPKFQKDGSQIYKTIEDYEFALTGTYSLLRATGYFGSGAQTTSTWAQLPDMMADNLVRTPEDLSNWLTQVNWVYTTAEDDIRVAWLAAYSVIAQANLVLRNIDQFSATEAKKVNRIKGQALALRAMAHFDLLRFWGESYDRNSTAGGVPYVEIVDIANKPPRLTVAATYDKIFADMQLAETLLGDVDKAVNSGTSRAYIDLLGVQALLSRMHLYSKNYAEAERYASLVITARALATRAEFPEIWKDATQAEVIWSLAFNPGEGSPATGIHIASSNRNRFRPATALENTYDQINDVRFAPYFATRALSGTPRRIINKFYGRGTAADNLVNWKALRTAEMYLIRAEARALQTGKEALGLADLNALRAARIAGYVDEVLSGQALLDAIDLERRKELVAEGHRWFDLRRTTKIMNRSANAADCSGVITCSLAADAREWVWPIPQAEIDANTTISTQQTTGYN